MNAVRGNVRVGSVSGSFVRIALVAALAALAGCETGGQTGALVGGGLGALIGQAAGGDTEATLIGAAVGTGVGYIIGNEADKKHAQEMEKTAPAPDYAHAETGPLAGTRWQMVSLAPSDYAPPYASKILEFDRDGRLITTTTFSNGHVETTDERYRVVGGTLIVNKPGYLVNAKYGIEGDELIIDADEFRAVLKRLTP